MLVNQHQIALFGEVLADCFPDKQILGGAPYNVTHHLTAFGCDAMLISRTGEDALHQQLMAEMQTQRVNTVGLQQDSQYPTGQVQVTLQDGEPSYDIVYDQAYDHIDADLIPDVMAAHPPDIVYFGTLAQRHPTARQALQMFLAHTDCPRFLDINLRAPWYDAATIQRSLEHADILKLNDEELPIVAAACGLATTNAEAQADALIDAFSLSAIIVTQGAQGAWCLDAAKQMTTAPQSTRATVMDTVGAGDGFAAVLLLGKQAQWDMETTLIRANQFAARLCEMAGAIPQSRDFYQPFLAEWQ